MVDNINEFARTIANFIWGPVLILFLVGTGLYFTFILRFIQVREFFHGIRITLGFFDEPTHKGQISHFQALCTALSATIGTGNIAGVATAIALGGPGAVFWMWITGFFGMVLKYASCGLAIKYRYIAKDGVVSGGPMYYLEKGLNLRWLACIFAFCTAVTAIIIGNMVQSNSVADALYTSLKVPKLLTGLSMAGFVWLVIIGGVKRIARVAQVIAPFMCCVYVLGALYIIFVNYDKIPSTISFILRCAFTPTAAIGGFVGSGVMHTIRMGIARGLFSNEAGLGSAPIAHAAAKEDEPAREGLVAMMGPFVDTILICTLTALVIVISGLWSSGLSGATLTARAFDASTQGLGNFIVSFGLIFFALSTTIVWAYYGDRSVFYLFGDRGLLPYKWIYCGLMPLGAVMRLELIWNLADITNGFMAVPNLIGILGLSRVVVKFTRDYDRRLRFARRFHKR